MFRTFLRDVIARKHTSRNNIAAEIGITHQDLDEAIMGAPVRQDTTDAVCKWLEIPSSEMFTSEKDPLAAVVAMFEENASDLVIILRTAAEEMRNQTMTEEDFRDIVKYALERIEARKKAKK